MPTTTTTNAIERELKIEASPEIVYSYFTDPAKVVQWMGREANLDARPGGEIRVDYGGFDRMRGEFLELVPHSRIVFTWGWSTLGTQTPPGASRVEVTLAPEGSGTLLRVVHSGLEGAQIDGHAQGWDFFLPTLAQAAKTGTNAQAPAEALTPPVEYAARLNALLCDLRYLIEGMDDAAWAKTAPGSGWTVGATTAHAVSHAGLAHMAAMVAGGQRPPVADVTLDVLNEGNAKAAAESASISRNEVLASLLKDGPVAVEAVKALDPASLGNTQPMAFAGGAPVPAVALLEGPMLGDLATHIADIQAAR